VSEIEVIEPEKLDDEVLARWRALQAEDPSLQSPFLSPEFALAVASVRRDVRIAVVRQGRSEIAALLPYQIGPRGDGVPIGYPYSDRHGLLAAPGLGVLADEIARACGLTRFHFRNVPAQQEAFQPFIDGLRSSPAVEIARFRPRPHEARRFRKLARERGPLRFEPDASSPEVLATLVAWKRAQAAAAGQRDPLAHEWIRTLLPRLLEARGPHLRAVLSALYAGDALVAAHLGLRSESTWHWWVPSYDVGLAEHSPGLLLLLEMLGHAPAAGVALLDFGPGPEPFKRRFCTTLLPLVRGCVLPSKWDGRVWRVRRAVRSAVSGHGVERLARALTGRRPLAARG
jgi:CelD/BcsL family acetyltransferase involved in cellulose biosynthesis